FLRLATSGAKQIAEDHLFEHSPELAWCRDTAENRITHLTASFLPHRTGANPKRRNALSSREFGYCSYRRFTFVRSVDSIKSTSSFSASCPGRQPICLAISSNCSLMGTSANFA